ncbi:MAG: NAD(P)-binding oxidoreductase [Longimicrobiales bacterium]
MPERHVLLVGGTGRTGGRVLTQLLDRGVHVRAIVRSAQRLPAGVLGRPGLVVVEADLLSLGDEALLQQVRGCDTVISCLGHVLSLKGVFGPPRDLVTRATARLCRAIEAARPDAPVRLIVMSSVSVNHPGAREPRRGALEKMVLWLLRGLVPPAGDNQRAADFLHDQVGTGDPFVRWVLVRPDSLLEGDVTPYALHETIVDGLFKPGSTNMANVAHFMCELATRPTTWNDWSGELPVIVNEV